jgi:hypothetical protein
MQIGICGAPGSGKTTVFNVLARAHAEVGGYRAPGSGPNVAVVHVPDERLYRLSAIYKPKKTEPAEVTYADVGGIAGGAGRENRQQTTADSRQPTAGSSSAFLAQLRNVDVLLQVVRGFPDAALGPPAPIEELETVQLELLMADLDVVEHRLERLRKEAQLGKAAPSEAQHHLLELRLFERLQAGLSSDQPVRDLDLSEADRHQLKSYALLTAKPLLVLANVEEPGPQAERLAEQLAAAHPHQATTATSLAGKLEMELAELEPAEASEFMAELGIGESGLSRVIRLSYQLSNLITFFTVGPNECHAWSIQAGSTALDAAGAIHTDFARGFIRAEVISYDDLITCGSQPEARKKGLLRTEGKTYLVQDGDVINILFNI